jgi:hypothetical protein
VFGCCRGLASAAEEAAAVKQLAEELAAELAPLYEALNAACDYVKEADSTNVRVVTTTAATATAAAAAADSVSQACPVGCLCCCAAALLWWCRVQCCRCLWG